VQCSTRASSTPGLKWTPEAGATVQGLHLKVVKTLLNILQLGLQVNHQDFLIGADGASGSTSKMKHRALLHCHIAWRAWPHWGPHRREGISGRTGDNRAVRSVRSFVCAAPTPAQRWVPTLHLPTCLLKPQVGGNLSPQSPRFLFSAAPTLHLKYKIVASAVLRKAAAS
jgi:hypothetical protein